MKHQKIDAKDRVWIVTRGCDGSLQEQMDVSRLDPQFLTSLGTASSADEVAEVIAIAAGQMEIAETRLW